MKEGVSLIRRLSVFILILLILTASAFAEINIPQDTAAQTELNDYIAKVNDTLVSNGYSPINSVFMCFETLATLGVTAQDQAQVPESVEITVTMDTESLNTLVLRCTDPDQFAALAAACIYAATPAQSSFSAQLKSTSKYAAKAKSDPLNSFEDKVNELKGDSIRTYYAYYPNQYQDDHSWLQLTLVFSRKLGADTEVYVTPVPDAKATPADEYEGIKTKDDYTHFEVFTTPTPEPDSPAGAGKQ